MISKKNMGALDKAGIDYILGVRMRQAREVYGDILERGGRWQEVTVKWKHNNKEWVLKAKESFQGGRRYIVCLNEEQARRDAMVREAILANLKGALSQGSKSLVGNRGYRKYLRAEGEGFAMDLEKAEDESRYDGRWVLRTNLTKMSAPEVALKYRELRQVEKVFRDVKSVLETRPIYHQRDETIRGHVFCSFLALILRKELEKRLQAKGHNFEWSDIRQDLESLQEVKISSGNKRTSVRTECKGVCGKVFQAVGVAIPPVIRSLGNGPPTRPKRGRRSRRSATQENCAYNQRTLP